MSAKFAACVTCYFNNRAPEICEGCFKAREYQPIDDEPIDDEIEELTQFSSQDMS